VKVLTVRQPWASAIFNGKPVENRTTNIFGAYRGPVAIHAGRAYEEDAIIWAGATDIRPVPVDPEGDAREMRAVIIGVVNLIDAHTGWSVDCDCDDATGWPEPNAWHGVLEHPRALATPIPYKGALGLRDLPGDVERQIREQLPLFCSKCGCTDDNACTPPCSWVPCPEGWPPLCSRCFA